ncbi:3-dehydroquinate dehydratase type I [Trema orientale]|uniref:3-dehydroquinate dehydratase type I n=1 Tax=Trema orientale TaxID=63057 RepID=A0A2P5FFW2_TREOI|nr:3-dehydroquinate dehydratase type I [Trema orientale]
MMKIPIHRLNESRTTGKSNSKYTDLQVLRLALELDVEFIEMEYEVASDIAMAERKPSNSQTIVSSYVNGGKSSREELGNLIACIQSTRADVIKLNIEVDSITDVTPIFQMLTHSEVPLIATAVGSRGLISQLLAPKFGGFFVYGSLKRHSSWLTNFGPILHNRALRHTGYNGIYVPMLVDNVKEFFKTYTSMDFAGFSRKLISFVTNTLLVFLLGGTSVGIPHKEEVVKCCDEVHPLAKSIGAVNTIVRRPSDGKLIGYNTDCEACITAIEDALREREGANGVASHASSPIAGKIFVLVGAGGVGRALAFGAKDRGAQIVIFNRNYERAKALASAVSGEAFHFEYLDSFCPEEGMILANASSVGMEPNANQSPVSKVSFYLCITWNRYVKVKFFLTFLHLFRRPKELIVWFLMRFTLREILGYCKRPLRLGPLW